MDQKSLHFILINGRGSSGKDTQANLLVQDNPRAVRISTGEIYREAKTPDGEYGQFHEVIKPYIPVVDNGGFVPDSVMLPIVGEVIDGYRSEGINTFVFTGFPRTVGQLEAFDSYVQALRDTGETVRADFLCYAVLEGHSIRRAETRRTEAAQLGVGFRDDDDPQVVLRRLEGYRRNTEPMLHLLARSGRLSSIKSSGTIDEVHARTMRALEIKQTDFEVQGRTPERHG